ncbi:hypothetical protein VPH35_079842 [Triticum aestivum]
MAAREALALAKDLACTKIVVATDCLSTVNHLKTDYMGWAKAIIFELKRSMQDFVSAVVLREKRDSNLEAYSLAKAVISLHLGRHVWLTEKPNLSCIPDNIMS